MASVQTDIDRWQRDRLLEALDFYRRGLTDSPHVQKWVQDAPAIATEAEVDTGPMTFVVSTDEVDRAGDTIAVDGWKLDSYCSNPVVLWAHNHTRPAIGRALDVWPHDHTLMARVEFAPTPFAQEVAGLYRAGYQRGVSVGFKPIRFEMRREGSTGKLMGVRFLEQELLEISAAPVPANASALRKALGNAPLLQSYYNDLGNDQWDFQEIMASLKSIRE